MARFYFDIRDGDVFVPDHEGWEYASVGDACDEAVRTLADLAREAVRAGHKKSFSLRMSIEVRDEGGTVVEVGFAFEVARRRLDA